MKQNDYVLSDPPFFSIVIATYNYGRFLGQAIESVINQSCQDYELIVVDGGSKDNTLDVIRKYERYISWWVSEPDKGQSNAFNKGFSHSKGKFLTWLNADDIYLPGALEAVKIKLLKNPDAGWATGNFLRFRDDNGIIIEAKWGPHFLPRFLQTPDAPLVIFGPTTFWSRKIYEDVGELDESLHYAMDTDYWWRIVNKGYKQVRVNHCCWAFRMHEASKTAEYGEHMAEEKTKREKQNEAFYIKEKSNINVSIIKKYVGYMMRILDGSFLKYLFLKIFMVGKKFRIKQV